MEEYTINDLKTHMRETFSDGPQKWVGGMGAGNARVMILGNAPKIIDSNREEVFSGGAGGLLRKALSQANLSTTDYYMTYICKYAMYADRKPRKSDIKHCSDLLRYEIETVKPDIIIPLGANPLEASLGKGFKISTLVGAVLDSKLYPGVKVIPMWDPGYILRNPSLKEQWYDEFQKVYQLLVGQKPVEKYTGPYENIVSNADVDRVLLEWLDNPPTYISPDVETGGGMSNFDPKAYCRSMQFGLMWGDDPSTIKAYSFRTAPVSTREQPVEGGLDYSVNYDCCSPWYLCQRLEELFKLIPDIKIVGQNGRFDGKWFIRHGLDIRPYFHYDTMLAEHLIDDTVTTNLTDLTLRYTNMGKYDAELQKWKADHPALVGAGDGYGLIPYEIIEPYGAADVIAPLIIMLGQRDALAPYLVPRGFENEYCSLYQSVINASVDLYEIELEGMHIDVERLEQMTELFNAKRKELTQQLKDAVVAVCDEAGYDLEACYTSFDNTTAALLTGVNQYEDVDGRSRQTQEFKDFKAERKKLRAQIWVPEDFNPGSSDQCQRLLFGRDDWSLKLMPLNSTGSGKDCKPWDWVLKQSEHIQGKYNPSTDKQTCEILAPDHPLVALLLKWKRINVMCNNILRETWEEDGKGLRSRIWPDGKIHSIYGQKTATGRFTSSDPEQLGS